MKFCVTTNLKTKKTYYYVNGDRRTKDAFEFQEILARVRHLKYNASQLTTDNKFQRFTFYYN